MKHIILFCLILSVNVFSQPDDLYDTLTFEVQYDSASMVKGNYSLANEIVAEINTLNPTAYMTMIVAKKVDTIFNIDNEVQKLFLQAKIIEGDIYRIEAFIAKEGFFKLEIGFYTNEDETGRHHPATFLYVNQATETGHGVINANMFAMIDGHNPTLQSFLEVEVSLDYDLIDMYNDSTEASQCHVYATMTISKVSQLGPDTGWITKVRETKPQPKQYCVNKNYDILGRGFRGNARTMKVGW